MDKVMKQIRMRNEHAERKRQRLERERAANKARDEARRKLLADREAEKKQKAEAEYKAMCEAWERSPEGQRQRITNLSLNLGDRDIITIDNLDDQYEVALYRSDEWFKQNAESIEKQTGLFVSNHEGFYDTYTRQEMREQFPYNRRYRRQIIRVPKQILGAFELPIAMIKLICVPFIAMFMLPIAIYKWWCENDTVRYVVYTILIVIVIGFVLSLPIGLLHLLAYLNGYTN